MVPFFSQISGSGLLLSLLFVFFGLAVAWLARKFLDLTESGAAITLLLLPPVAYLVFSGQLESFKGGGLEWKLREAGSAPAIQAWWQGSSAPRIFSAGSAAGRYP